MNGSRIEELIRRDVKCRLAFVGVFACDRLPERISEHALLVCNTDPHDRPGQHWIVLYVENSSYGEYFDSFGRPPQDSFRDFLNRHCDIWIHNSKQLQSSVSNFCGHYCIFYCTHRCRNKNITFIANTLTTDTGLNDYLVHNYVCQLIANKF